MTLLSAATRQPGPLAGPLGVALLVGLVLLCYACSCWWFPFGKCWCCKGAGKHQRDDRKVLRLCRWCRGTGLRLRLGRRVWNRFANVRRDSAR